MQKLFYVLIAIMSLQSCSLFQPADLRGRQGKVIQEGFIDCFPVGTKYKKGKTLNCETSAVVYYNNQIIAANDKPTPGSSVFSMPYSEEEGFLPLPTSLENNVFNVAKKIEDFTISPDGQLIVGTTAFNEFNAEKPKKDAHNTVFYWQPKKEMKAQIAHLSQSKTKKGIYKSSKKVRQMIAAAFEADNLEVPNYYKIEGLAIIPGNKILFGIREMGSSYKKGKFTYQIKIIQADYIFAKSRFEMNNFRIAYDFDASKTEFVNHDIGLSSIEYDKYNDRLYILTSHEDGETDEELGAYLWVLPMVDYKAKNAPKLVMKSKKKPLYFAHKSEAITVIDKNTVFIINDDDRVTGREKVKDKTTQFSRQPNQSTYYFVKMK